MKLLKSFLIDLVVWVYLMIIIYTIVWQKILHSERYIEFTSIELLYCLIVGLLISLLLFLTKKMSLGVLFYNQDFENNTPTYKNGGLYIGILAILLTLVSGWVITEISISDLFSVVGFNQAMKLFGALFTPEISILKRVIVAAIETIYMALMATTFAIPFAFIISFFSAKNIMKGSVNYSIYFSLRLIMNFMRSIEPLIWAIIFSVWIGIGPYAGMLALTVHSIVSLAKLYSEQIEEVDEGTIEAIKATGASQILTIWYGVVPQIINPFLGYTIYRWDINVRMATIIGMVGGGGIGNLLMQYQGMAKWNEVGTIVLVIAVIGWVMDLMSAKIRERLSR